MGLRGGSIWAVALLLLAAPSAGLAQAPTYLGTVVEGEGHMLRAVYRGGTLRPGKVSAAVLRRSGALRGADMTARPVQVRLLSIDPAYEPPGHEFTARVLSPLPPDSVPHGRTDSAWLAAYSRYGEPAAVLVSSGPDSVQCVPSDPVQLSAATEAAMARTADSLWRAALRDQPEIPAGGYKFARREIRRAAGLDVVHVWQQVVIPGGDPRGSFYFVIRASTGAILSASFGHPEWSPNSSLVQIRPYLFFRVGSDRRTFLLAQHELAWEDYSGGWAILDAASGRVLATSN
jgi:hypothetical protein